MQLFLNGIQNFLMMINENWTTIIVIIGFIIMIFKKIKDFLYLSEDEKVQAAKDQLQNIVLSLVSNAELDYKEYEAAGQIKRSQVIDEIFEKYPILTKVTDQEELLEYIDKLIDEALETVRVVVGSKKEEEKDG